ncbi:MAG TPA: hypothetical protein VIO61_13035 [Anaerolineaceae bacterium]
MDQHLINQICDQIYRQYPEVSGKKPKVQSRPGSQVLLIFQATAIAANGQKIPRTVRVIALENGKISKITTSH